MVSGTEKGLNQCDPRPHGQGSHRFRAFSVPRNTDSGVVTCKEIEKKNKNANKQQNVTNGFPLPTANSYLSRLNLKTK